MAAKSTSIREGSYISFYCQRNTLKVFTQALRLIGHPHLVRFRFNAVDGMLLMEAAETKDGTTFWVSNAIYADSKHSSLRIFSKELCSMVIGCMGLDQNKCYRVPGMVFQEISAIRFDLSLAEEIKSSRRKATLKLIPKEPDPYGPGTTVFYMGKKATVLSIDRTKDVIVMQEKNGPHHQVHFSWACDEEYLTLKRKRKRKPVA